MELQWKPKYTINDLNSEKLHGAVNFKHRVVIHRKSSFKAFRKIVTNAFSLYKFSLFELPVFFQ